jgi:hypothetical protein
MPSEEEMNHHHWRTFGVEPGAVLNQRSLVFRQLGSSNRGGLCIVEGGRHVDAVGTSGIDKHRTVEVEYAQGTAVAALTVRPGDGDGKTYWYPYIEKGVGECDIDYDVAVGTTALTAGMNGCSLRIYVNPVHGLIKFCHDNNGLYADDAAYARQGFQHLQSINADKRTRGEPAQNINDYWTPEINAPATGIFFICRKTSAMAWTIYQSVAIGGRREIITERVLRPNLTKVVHPFSGTQMHNKVVAVVNIPPRTRAATTDNLPDQRVPVTGAMRQRAATI